MVALIWLLRVVEKGSKVMPFLLTTSEPCSYWETKLFILLIWTCVKWGGVLPPQHQLSHLEGTLGTRHRFPFLFFYPKFSELFLSLLSIEDGKALAPGMRIFEILLAMDNKNINLLLFNMLGVCALVLKDLCCSDMLYEISVLLPSTVLFGLVFDTVA